MGSFASGQRLSDALVPGLRTALDDLINNEDIPDGDRVYISLASNRLTNAYNGWGLRAGEWRRAGQRADALLGNLSHMLNSNEQFEMDDSFLSCPSYMLAMLLRAVENEAHISQVIKARHVSNTLRDAFFAYQRTTTHYVALELSSRLEAFTKPMPLRDVDGLVVNKIKQESQMQQ